MKKRIATLPSLLLAALLLLSACGGENVPDAAGGSADEPFEVNVRLRCAQDPLDDPALVTSEGGETALFCLYENLLRWTGGDGGFAVLSPGQAQSWTVETDYAGNETYTFTLRETARWSDGEKVTASDFVSAWRRLADPAAGSPHSGLLEKVAGYDQVRSTGDVSLLEVSAPDESTFVVRLSGSCAWFLSEVCAGAYTVPVRDGATNGPFTLLSQTAEELILARSETYYDRLLVGPDQICFTVVPDDAAAYALYEDGALDLDYGLPDAVVAELAEDGSWTPVPVCAVYTVLLNTCAAPFDDPSVRLAFRLAVDTQAVAQAAGGGVLRPAAGLVPYGVADFGESAGAHTASGAAEEEDASSAPAEDWDFRIHSRELVTVPEESDYAADCARARQLLSEAGFPGGEGLPVAEYLYVDGTEDRAVAEALRDMWLSQLGAEVSLRAVSQTEYDAAVAAASGGDTQDGSAPGFTLAARWLTPSVCDAGALLKLWYSTNAGNVTGYASESFDILLNAASAPESVQARDGLLHDAEAILLADAPAIPVFYDGGAYVFSEELTGLVRSRDGRFFLSGVRPGAT